MTIYRQSLLCLLLLCLAGCDKLPLKKKPQYEVRPIKVEVQTMDKQTRVNTHTYVGRIEEASSVPLSVQTAGQVTAVYVKKGDHVKAGQELLRLDDTQARNAMLAANATYQQAADGYRRARQVYAKGVITEMKMVEVSSQLEQARSVLAMSRKSLNDCVLRAPSDGVIGECKAKAGQVVAPGLSLVTLLDMEGYNVTFDVAEGDITSIQVGDSGSVVVEAIGKTEVPVCVTEKNLLANTIAHTYTVTAFISNPSDEYKQQLLPGMVSKVRLRSQSVSGYFVPAACVQTLTSGASVWVVENGIATRRRVEIGQYASGGVLITRGLHEGDQVVVEGFQKLYNGAKTSPTPPKEGLN